MVDGDRKKKKRILCVTLHDVRLGTDTPRTSAENPRITLCLQVTDLAWQAPLRSGRSAWKAVFLSSVEAPPGLTQSSEIPTARLDKFRSSFSEAVSRLPF